MPLIRDHHWALGSFPCKLLPSLTILNMFASVFVLTAISADRCALVTLPIWCQNHRSARLAWGVCGAAWLLSLLLTVPSFIFRKTKSEVFAVKVMCVLDYTSVSGHQQATEVATAALRFACGFLVPFAVICSCYGLVLMRIHKSRFGRSRKTLKVVLVVVVGFFVCWLPYHVTGLIMASKLSSDPLFHRIHQIDPLIVGIAYINSCINPVIYVLVGQDFKVKFRRSLRGLLREALTEDLPSTGDSKARTRSTMDKSTTTTI
ncbi:C5a anaphylatoxin chemotactic receptor 1 [Alligator mississippiensis]|uniref:C5a anaphylatoxin chemotactic receptor 1 n=2 Tax=Alligator mississippiensis TaxID=8496 RepID=A0A151P0K6_ALLMI|nr:C5a anaphylatoxin chemotactic receptor 1 [Alligator mississippiensis]